MLKSSAYGQKPPEFTPAWADELGDAFFALLCLANQTGVDLEEALQRVMEKYRQRIAQSGEAGSGK